MNMNPKILKIRSAQFSKNKTLQNSKCQFNIDELWLSFSFMIKKLLEHFEIPLLSSAKLSSTKT